MNRTLTAAVALAAGLGMAGLAHAQSSAGPATQPNTVSPSAPSTQMTPPMSSPTPNAMQHPGAMANPTGSSSGGQHPQASAQPDQMNPAGQPGASQSQIEQVQQQLKSQGLYNGAIDGIVGPETQTALMQFQREQGLPETAQLDQQTLGRLMNGSSSGGQNMSGTGNGTARAPGSTEPAGTHNPATLPTNR